ncbi:hypothetical protein [Pandoravirus japonicus]|uniref:Uncharacterized protein n=1 Tax=Pandoravirus japonicus TaxID=2823154 RepID=A0A811BM31_9VIRU|nr:hypothetical protein [Pandoravirus japonicus]
MRGRFFASSPFRRTRDSGWRCRSGSCGGLACSYGGRQVSSFLFFLLQTLKVAAANGKKVSSSTSSTRQRVHSKISSAIFFSTIYVGKKRQ